LDDWILVSLNVHWYFIVWIDLLDDARFSCRTRGLEEFVSCPVLIDRYVFITHVDFLLVNNLEWFNVSS